MYQFLIGIILALSGFSYYLWQQNEVLQDNNVKLENAVATQQETIETLRKDFAKQAQSLIEMTEKSQAAQRELNRYTEFIQNYKLTAKILENPAEMQRKINNGTKHIMEDIEKLSVIVDDLDNGLQLQSTAD